MKKLVLYVASAAVFLAACNGKSGKITLPAGKDSTQNNTELNRLTALQVVNSLSNKNLDSMFVALAPDFVDYGSGTEEPKNNIDSIKADIKEYVATFPDLKAENINAFAHGDSVVVTATWGGTFKNAQRTRLFRFDDADIFIFNGSGKIKAHRSMQDKALFFAQLNMESDVR
ncbi:ester cyclase [Mucilaginibacter sp. AW1-3]